MEILHSREFLFVGEHDKVRHVESVIRFAISISHQRLEHIIVVTIAHVLMGEGVGLCRRVRQNGGVQSSTVAEQTELELSVLGKVGDIESDFIRTHSAFLFLHADCGRK